MRPRWSLSSLPRVIKIVGMRTFNIPFWFTDLYKQDGASINQFYHMCLCYHILKGILAPPVGLEPTTYWLTANRSTDWAKGEYIRAVYLQDNAQVLNTQKGNENEVFQENLVAGGGFEPPTSWLWAKRAARLLYPAIVIKGTQLRDAFLFATITP